MTPYNPRIVFAAVVAYTEKISKDGRMLAAPEGFMCPVRQLPVPVLWTPPNRDGKARPSCRIGEIESAYVVDRRVITFGHLDDTEEIRQGVVPLLQSGAWFLEIDMDAGDIQYGLDPLLPEQGPTGPVVFKSWKLLAAWIGDHPCWDLPHVQVEEITR